MFVDAFIELNKHKGVEKITIQELANKAGYNRATFYEYFGDIYGLMAYMEDAIIAYIKQEVVNRIGNLPVEDLFVKLFISKNIMIVALGIGGSDRAQDMTHRQ